MAAWILMLSTLLHGADPSAVIVAETSVTADSSPRYAGIEQMFAKFSAEQTHAQNL